MSSSPRLVIALPAALVALTALAACGSDGNDAAGGSAPTATVTSAATSGAVTPTTATCPGPADPAAALPEVPALPGEVRYRKTDLGATQVYFGRLAGTSDDIVSTRDALVTALKGKGFTITGTDAEPGAEAEAEFTGPIEGSIAVRADADCAGFLNVRYKKS